MGSTRANVTFIGSVIAGLFVFAAIALPGDSLSVLRFSLASAAFLATSWGGAWALSHTLQR